MDRLTFYGKSFVCQPLLDLSTAFMFVAQMLLGSNFALDMYFHVSDDLTRRYSRDARTFPRTTLASLLTEMFKRRLFSICL
jgi:hypothetical protein